MTSLLEADYRALAKAWLAVDPDADTRMETERLLSAGDEDLAERFGDRLSFGTAGLRGRLGAGPMRMNRVLVRVVAAAVVAQAMEAEGDKTHVVIAFDARHRSRTFAEDTARIVAANGLRCTFLPVPVATPVLAFAVKHLDASVGVMVTASHNPREDNGYKVFWRGGAQITDPIDAEITARIEQTPLLGDDDLASLYDPLIELADDALTKAYMDAVVGLLSPDGDRSARVAYTPLHGVAGDTVERAFVRAGFPKPETVAEQAQPDPNFPTTPVPNPEEPGVLEPLLSLASEIGADVALANDPDGDRLAVAVPNGPGWRLLTGDEVGCLLADHLLRRPNREQRERLVANTVVSSRLLADVAAHYGATHTETLTGFKWLMKAADERPDHEFVLGYEEALGYAIGDVVRDKDGISAALVVAEMVGGLQAEGSSAIDLLEHLHTRHGVHVTGQRAIRFEPASGPVPVMSDAMDTLRAALPTELAGMTVLDIVDLAGGSGSLPPTEGIVFELEGARVVVRPSGTEPKLKVYGEVMTPATAEPAQTYVDARASLNALLDAVVTIAAGPERHRRTWADAPVDEEADGAVEERAAAAMATPPVGVERAADLRLIARCIDLTTLEGDDTSGRVRALCARARRPDAADPTVGPTAAVCVYPELVGLAKSLSGGGVRVAAVAGAFPSGLSSLPVRLADIRDAIDAGADEVDIVLNRSAFLDGRVDEARDEIVAARQEVGNTHLKVILEVGELRTVAAIRAASRLAIEAGADTIKTSTGKSGSGASPTAVQVMAEVVAEHLEQTGREVGIKISGGVRTADDALRYVSIVRSVLGERWLTPELLRFGASSLLDDLLVDLAETEIKLRS